MKEGKSQGGFKRGFLLSKPKEKKQKAKQTPPKTSTHTDKSIPTVHHEGKDASVPEKSSPTVLTKKATSSDLLDLESESTSRQGPAKATRSMLSMLLDEESKKEKKLDPPVLAKEPRSMLSVLFDESNTDERGQNNLGLVEITSSSVSPGKNDSSSHRHHYEEEPWKEEEAPPEESATHFLKCQQDLDQTLWQLRRKRRRRRRPSVDWHPMAKEFCDKLDPTHVSFVWDYLLRTCPKQSPQCWAELRLGRVLLESTLESFASFSMPSNNKHDRVCSLGALTILEFWCSSKPTAQVSWVVTLLNHVMAPLEQQLAGGQDTPRTILTQKCVTAIYNLVSTTSAMAVNTPSPKLSETIWKISCLTMAWDIHLVWTAKFSDQDGAKDRAKKACTHAVVKNWKESLEELRNRQVDDGQIHQEWCRLLQGVRLGEAYVGSIGQTLLKEVLGEDQIMICLSQAVDNGKQCPSAQAESEQVALARGMVAWLGQNKNHSLAQNQQVFELSSSLIRFALSDSVISLAEQILSMQWVDTGGFPPDIQDYCSNKGSEAKGKDIPNSIKYWMQLLGGENTNTSDRAQSEVPIREESIMTLCRMIASSIVHISRIRETACAKAVISSFISQNGGMASKPTVRTLIWVMRELRGAASPEKKHKTGSARNKGQSLLDHIGCDLLLDQSAVNDVIRECIRHEQEEEMDPFLSCTVTTLVPKQIRILATHAMDASNDDTAGVVLSSLTSCLGWNLDRSSDHVNTFVEAIVETMIAIMDESSNLHPSLADALSAAGIGLAALLGRTCILIGERWRSALLSGDNDVSKVDPDSSWFGSVLAAVACAMFRFPSSTVPLTFFGALVGDGQNFDLDTVSLKAELGSYSLGEVLANAAFEVIRLSVSELDVLMKESGSSSRTDVSGSIFRRLAPLLLLRRVPPRLFHEAYREWATSEPPNKREVLRLLQRLAGHLANRLDINVALRSTRPKTFSAEERQMAAEVAGRCLPFHKIISGVATQEVDQCSGPTSCFQRICIPGFAGMHETLVDDTPVDQEDARNKIRQARAALYAVCHFVPFCGSQRNEDVGDALLSTSLFCLDVLNAKKGTFESTSLDQDFLQLQSGCIEFFAVCVEQMLSIRSASLSNSATQCSAPEYLQRIYGLVIEITRTGLCKTVEPQPWMLVEPSKVSLISVGNEQPQQTLPDCSNANGVGHTKALSCSVACVTCLWNSLIVVSQRCPDQGGKVQSLAQAILPWLVTWGGKATRNESGGSLKPHHHPLCVTAALQLAFILVTRSKSFGGLPSRVPNDDSGSIQMLQQWAFHAVKDGRNESGFAFVGLRLAGLKVLLAVVTIGQVMGSISALVFSRDEIGEILSLVNDVAKNDEDPKVQALASHLLSAVVA